MALVGALFAPSFDTVSQCRLFAVAGAGRRLAACDGLGGLMGGMLLRRRRQRWFAGWPGPSPGRSHGAHRPRVMVAVAASARWWPPTALRGWPCLGWRPGEGKELQRLAPRDGRGVRELPGGLYLAHRGNLPWAPSELHFARLPQAGAAGAPHGVAWRARRMSRP